MELVINVDGALCWGFWKLFWLHFCSQCLWWNFCLGYGVTDIPILDLVAAFFNKLCVSAFSFKQLLKSRKLDFTQCFLIVKSDSFILGRSFCTAVLRSAALFKSESYESDLKTQTRLEMHPQKLMMLSLLCIFTGGKLLSLSKWALTTVCGWLNLRSKVLNASFYIVTSASGSFLLLVKASVNALISAAGDGGLACGGPSQHNGIGAVCPNAGGITGVEKAAP